MNEPISTNGYQDQVAASIRMEEVTDPDELAAAQKRREQFERDSAWLQASIADVSSRNRGKCICISGQEVFVADTTTEAVALAKAAHPDD